MVMISTSQIIDRHKSVKEQIVEAQDNITLQSQVQFCEHIERRINFSKEFVTISDALFIDLWQATLQLSALATDKLQQYLMNQGLDESLVVEWDKEFENVNKTFLPLIAERRDVLLPLVVQIREAAEQEIARRDELNKA